MPAINPVINKVVRNITQTTICESNSGLAWKRVTVHFGRCWNSKPNGEVAKYSADLQCRCRATAHVYLLPVGVATAEYEPNVPTQSDNKVESVNNKQINLLYYDCVTRNTEAYSSIIPLPICYSYCTRNKVQSL